MVIMESTNNHSVRTYDSGHAMDTDQSEHVIICNQAEIEDQLTTIKDDIKALQKTTREGLQMATDYVEKFWRVFGAFVIMVEPVAVAMVFDWVTAAMDLNASTMAIRQTYMLLLIGLSVFVGIPLYVYAMMEFRAITTTTEGHLSCPLQESLSQQMMDQTETETYISDGTGIQDDHED